jgi:amino acid transporter
MFFWFSGLAVVSIVLIEALVCVAVIAYFGRHPGEEGTFTTKVAPVLALIGLGWGLVLLLPCSPVAEVEPRSASADLIRHIVF